MSDFYHEVLAFIEKQERFTKNFKARKILFRCAELPSMKFLTGKHSCEICIVNESQKC